MLKRTILLAVLYSLFCSAISMATPIERNIVISHDNVSLPGTLTLPDNMTGRVPVVIMIAGSGPADRDETIGPNKPFRDIAQRLANMGIATIRYDKRTKVYGTQTAMVSGGRLDYDTEVTDDVVQALKQAVTLPEADTTRIFLLGHSLGGTLAPRIVTKAQSPVAGIIFMAALARPFWDTVRDQIRYIATTQGLSPTDANKLAEAQAQQLKATLPAEYLKMQEDYDALLTAKQMDKRLRLLFIQGGHDYQVTEEDLNLWKSALQSSHPKAEFRIFPTLDHLMRPLPQMAVPANYFVPGEISHEVTDMIGNFVNN